MNKDCEVMEAMKTRLGITDDIPLNPVCHECPFRLSGEYPAELVAASGAQGGAA